MPQVTDWKCTVCGHQASGKQPPETCPVCGAHRYRFIRAEGLDRDLERAVKEAFAGESKASVRNLAFAAQARQEGFQAVARLFQAVAEAEKVHAHEFLKYLEGRIGSTEENLRTAFENELKAKDDIYPGLLELAYAKKREDLVWSLVRSRDVEARHAELYKNALSALAAERNIDYRVCQVCGYVFEDEVPDNCPICRADKSQFKKFQTKYWLEKPSTATGRVVRYLANGQLFSAS